MQTITVVEVNNITTLPPTQNLVRVLLSMGYKVNLIGNNLSCLADDILNNNNFKRFDIPTYGGKTMAGRFIRKMRIRSIAIQYIRNCMKESDYLWTTSMETVVIVGKEILKYKNIMQLMELVKSARTLHNLIKIPLDGYAKKSWKNVAVEINRAYIQKIWWDLDKLPAVLPNKPFSLDYGDVQSDGSAAINIMKNENRRIILYLGGIWSDRNFEIYAKAIGRMNEYALYIVGKTFSNEGKIMIDRLQKEYGVVYLGGFNPPKHLAFVQYADIGLLPYKPIKQGVNSELNALYCAPNKIWEYAGFGVPMVGSDVLGLKLPFEQWNIGRCCDLNDENSIIKAIEEVDRNHDEMSKNCYKFYDSVDLEKIVSEILEDKN